MQQLSKILKRFMQQIVKAAYDANANKTYKWSWK